MAFGTRVSRQEPEHEDGHEHGRQHLAADVPADDRLEVEQHPREADVVRAWNDGEETAAQAVAVDHDVEREKHRAAVYATMATTRVEYVRALEATVRASAS